MNPRLKSILKYVSVSVLTLFLLYLAFRGMDWNSFVEGLRSCNYWWIFAAMAAGVLGTVLRGLRWRLLLLPIDSRVRRVDCCNAYAVCYLSNIAVLRSGELVRCGMIADSSRVPFKDSLGSVMVERAWDILVSALMLVAMFFLTPFGSFMVEHIWNPFVASFSTKTLLMVIAFVVLLVLAILPVVRYMERIRRSRIGGKVIDFIKGMFNGVKAAFKMKHGFLFVFYTVLVQLLYWLEVVFVIQAFPAVSHLTGLDALFIMMLGLV